MPDISTIDLGDGIEAEISDDDVTLIHDLMLGDDFTITLTMAQYDHLNAAVSKRREGK